MFRRMLEEDTDNGENNIDEQERDHFEAMGSVLLRWMPVIAEMPANDFVESMDDELLALIEQVYLRLDFIPNNPRRQTDWQKYFLDVSEKFFKIIGAKIGMFDPKELKAEIERAKD